MISVAIDGPSGAGKSTLSRQIASKLGFIYVDTGALYRTIGLAVLNANIDTKDLKTVSGLLPKIKLELKYVNGEQRMFLNGKDVSDDIRTPEVSMAASDVSAHVPVREFLLETQRELASSSNAIMDGRDIGTVVLPNANIKIFLTASAQDRAQRRFEELLQKGQDVNYDDVLSDVITRDKNDETRAAAPLKPADDAILVNTTGNTFEQSLLLLQELIENKIKEDI